jgi:hypothetical protein
MKKGAFVTLTVLATAIVHGQVTLGRIEWGNNYQSANFRSLLYAPDPLDLTASHVGQSSSTLERPMKGTTVYQGAPLAGTGYTFGFFAGPAGSSSNILTLYGSASFRTGAAAGLVPIGDADIAGVSAGEQATFQIRVWNNEGGTITDWAQAEVAWLNGSIDAAVSPLVLSDPLGGTDSRGYPVLPGIDSGWASFNTYFVEATFAPEPGTSLLTAVGAAALLIFRRGK